MNYEQEFLIALFKQKNREIYARIISIDKNEIPLEEIQGKITGGSINIDGSSAIHRSCSLTMICDQPDINQYYWEIKNKFKLDIGLRNQLIGEYGPGNYPEIVWFPQGTYVITTFNTSISTHNCTISISGKDKMCLLNGELGGALFAQHDFGIEEVETTTMDVVDFSVLPQSSEFLINKDYYIKQIFFSSEEYQIFNKNPNYEFIKNQENGRYRKGNDGYFYLLENHAIHLENQEYYDGYKKVINPEDFFNPEFSLTENEYSPNTFYKRGRILDNNNEPSANLGSYYIKTNDNQYQSIQFSNYIKNTYYYKKTNGNYILEENDNFNPSRVYYTQINNNEYTKVYFYSPGKYYHTSSSDYFVLDTADTKSNYTNYYFSLKPIYTKNINTNKEKNIIRKIIREAVHTYADEPYYNIIINDLDDYGLEQLTYRGEYPLYILRNDNNNINLILEGQNKKLDDIIKLGITFSSYNALINGIEDDSTQIIVSEGDFWGKLEGSQYRTWENELTNNLPSENIDYYKIAKIEYGMDIGYQITDLIYTGELVCNVGEALTSLLDKIKTMLGDFEYFYDLNGKFIFQKKKTYVQTMWSQLTANEDNEHYINYANDQSKFFFNFENNLLISALQNTPVLNNLRNDFIVWGKRKTINGQDVPIHARYAIDKKPSYYKALNNKIYTTKQLVDEEVNIVDWREIIYQMAIDYFAVQGCSSENPVYLGNNQFLTSPDNFLNEVASRNPELYPTGKTGYEQYYTDIQGFWRQLYNPDYMPKEKYKPGYYNEQKIWIEPEVEDYEIQYYIDENNEKAGNIINKYPQYIVNNDKLYWNIDVFEHPENLNFWIEFLDSNLELSQFSVPALGDRTKVVNDNNKTSSIVYSETPEIILYQDYKDIEKTGDNYTAFNILQVSGEFADYFTISSQGTSLKEKIDNLLYQYAYCAENITITAIPIYYLEPNTRIFVQDDDTNINGEYIVSRITLPLTYNGTMSITATKAPEQLY